MRNKPKEWITLKLNLQQKWGKNSKIPTQEVASGLFELMNIRGKAWKIKNFVFHTSMQIHK